MALKSVEIFTDGACSGNPGPGGWGTLLRCGDHEKEMFGGESETTNNRMELMAVIRGLEEINKPCAVTIVTDSLYVKDGATKWMPNWKSRNWRTSSNEPVKNDDLWRRLEKAAHPHNVSWLWVKGHSGHVENERVDALARQGIKGLKSVGAA